MNPSSFSRFWPVLAVLTAALLACNTPMRLIGVEPTLSPAVESSPTAILPVVTETGAAPVLEATPTDTAPAPAVTLTQPVQAPFAVSTEVVKEESTEPPSPYVIDMEYPVFSGSPESAAAGLNQQINEIVTRQRAGFDEMVATPSPPEFMVGPHGFHMRYQVRHNDGRYVSVYFPLSLYNSGAAHPLPYSETLTYDVANERVLQLEDLFQPGSDYLTVLSQKSIADLQSRGLTGGESGAEPLPENYRNWNLSPEGLEIVFDPYQVAPYAAGYQIIVIPWAELSDILALDF
jgi:hypothetical protein